MSARNSKDKKALKRRMFDNQKVRGYVPCRYCGRKLTFAQATLDHINPLSRGGEWMQGNLGFACAPCNKSKGNMDLREFLKVN